MVLDSDFLQKLKNEAQIVNKLNHENIIKIHGMIERYRTVFIIMEYLAGESILEKIHQYNTLPHQTVIHYLIQICKAIQYAYDTGILHRDINPGNLMVDKHERVKIVDFGIACSVQEEDELFDGAFPYLAPELLKGEKASLQSEIYALGISAFEMVTGQRPYPEEDPAVFIKMRHENEIRNPKQIVPVLPDHLNEFIVKACRINPAERFKNMNEAIELLTHGKDRK